MIKNLFQRRVPQIVGLYIGATWMMIEIGDWITGRFELAPNFTSYIFVGMVTLIPAVAVIAWFHGAPGKDEWTRVEKTVIPLNLALAVFAVFYLVGPMQEVSATEIVEVVDETGNLQKFEVPKAGFNRRLTVFFFKNNSGDEASDWLSYGLPVMLAHDLNHETPLISAATPFDSHYLREELRNKGFSDGSNAPRPLQIQLARERLSDALISGVLEKRGGQLWVNARLMNAETGAEIVSAEGSTENLLQLVDELSLKFRHALRLANEKQGETDPVGENLSGSVQAVEQFIEALRAANQTNDYPAALEMLDNAVAIDPSFAEAYSQQGMLQYLNGASQDAAATIEKAFAHDYRLTLASKFKLRALRYQFAGKVEEALRVLQMWTEVQPENPEAFRELGQLLTVQGSRQDDAMAALGSVLDLNPSAYDVYLQQATVEQTRGNFDAAADLAEKFLTYRPENQGAHLLLARISLAAGRLNEARESYLDAEVLAAGDLAPVLGLARLDIRTGRFDEAQQRVDALLARKLSPSQKVEVLNVVFELQYMQGRLSDTLVTLGAMDEAAQAFLPPVLRIIQIGTTVANSKALQGDFDGARAEIAEMATQMQPPFDSYLAFSTISIEAEAGNREAFLAALADAEAFYAATKNEVLAPFILWARAYGAWLNGDEEASLQHVKAALQAYDRSYISTLSEAAIGIESKIEMYKLLISLGRLDDAQAGLQAIIDAAPALATARQAMATLAIKRGDVTTARAQLQAVLEIWADADATYIRYRQAQEQLSALQR